MNSVLLTFKCEYVKVVLFVGEHSFAFNFTKTVLLLVQ